MQLAPALSVQPARSAQVGAGDGTVVGAGVGSDVTGAPLGRGVGAAVNVITGDAVGAGVG